MIYALRKPTVRLKIRQQLAQQVLDEVKSGKTENLRKNPWLVYVWDVPAADDCFCIYCNTALHTYRTFARRSGSCKLAT